MVHSERIASTASTKQDESPQWVQDDKPKHELRMYKQIVTLATSETRGGVTVTFSTPCSASL